MSALFTQFMYILMVTSQYTASQPQTEVDTKCNGSVRSKYLLSCSYFCSMHWCAGSCSCRCSTAKRHQCADYKAPAGCQRNHGDVQRVHAWG